MNGIGIYSEAGGLAWEDARLTDPEAGKRFYTDVFGYTYQPVPGAPDDYGTFHLGGDPLGGMGGMMGQPAGTPSHWVARARRTSSMAWRVWRLRYVSWAVSVQGGK